MVASFSALRGIRLALGLIVRWSSHYFRVTRFRLLLVYGDLSSNFFLAFLSSERYVNEIEPIKVIGSGMQSYINSKCSLHNDTHGELEA
ncbi:hypothetical protein LENED_003801 [Lentinula edodes]|uniref:Uncharacterized protein n=1 Tax=Lentinula edodes TaxID=5353 RepID=A0A1Q3E4K0_LENED|nr:hypothetical protein LENED_003801 [Lentinula edodes]